MKILLIGTGGTIAGVQENGSSDNSAYTSGVLSVENILDSLCLDEIPMNTQIVTTQFCNINSDDITDIMWLDLARYINQESNAYDAIIITHGTDTLEETCFFLDLTTVHRIPVILTCAMYPATSPIADGPSNLLESIKYACISCAANNEYHGVVVAFGGKIITSFGLHKAILNNEFTFNDYQVDWGEISDWNKYYDISHTHKLPYVPIAYFSANTPSDILYYHVDMGAQAIVLAGAGAGEYSEDWIQAVEDLSAKGIIFIRTSKISKAPVNNNRRLSKSTLSGGSLSCEKASVLTSLHLI